VAFKSDAYNLSRADDNSVTDIFVHDRKTGKTRLISKTSQGAGADGSSDHPSISGNGRFVAFQSEADNPARPLPRAPSRIAPPFWMMYTRFNSHA